MKIIQQATYGQHDAQIHQREYLYRGFIQVEKVSLSHRLFNQTTYTPVLQRELIQRPEAAGVLFPSRNVLPNNQIEMSYMDISKSSTGFRFRSLIAIFCARLLGIF